MSLFSDLTVSKSKAQELSEVGSQLSESADRLQDALDGYAKRVDAIDTKVLEAADKLETIVLELDDGAIKERLIAIRKSLEGIRDELYTA